MTGQYSHLDLLEDARVSEHSRLDAAGEELLIETGEFLRYRLVR